MGEHQVLGASDPRLVREYSRALLDDIRALEYLIDEGWIETDVRRIGVEQEIYLITTVGGVAPNSDLMLRELGDDRFSTELARFNLEANLPPRKLGSGVLADLEHDLNDVLVKARTAAQRLGIDVLLTGILPTLRRDDTNIDSLTPEVRYRYLNDSCMEAWGGSFTLRIDGVDRLESGHDCMVIEGANTSLQLHLQVSPQDAGRLYNLAQLISAPLLAAAANSPVLLGKRLWHETRVALFEYAFDYRSVSQYRRGALSRVGFGDRWVDGSILDIFRDNLARFRVIMTRAVDVNPFEQIAEGRAPELSALMLHNGTVWRWNRPCYGVLDGRPHLRIENRALPAGPTVIDEVANAALFYGLMIGLDSCYGDVSKRVSFQNAKSNFLACAREGLTARLIWVDDQRADARTLLLRELIPAAREGLTRIGVPWAHIDRYLGVVEERVRCKRTGARWVLDALGYGPHADYYEKLSRIVDTMREMQKQDRPVHTWETSLHTGATSYSRPPATVGDIMTTDLFTVRPDDILDLATQMMEWKHIRHVPVEDAAGHLVGLLATKELVRARELHRDLDGPVAVRSVMSEKFATAPPTLRIREGIRHLLSQESGCLLITSGGRLLGIATERDLLRAAHAMLATGDDA